MIIAIDFDDTLFQYVPPADGSPDYSGRPGSIGRPNEALIPLLRTARKDGDQIILWTCREGKALQEAVDACKAHGLEFDAVNDNLEELKQLYGNNSRKISADLYIDDKALKVEFPERTNDE